MSGGRDAPRRTMSALPEAADLESVQLDGNVDQSSMDIEPAEDTAPYIPPLASYRIQVRITDVRRGEPHIYPDEILDEHG